MLYYIGHFFCAGDMNTLSEIPSNIPEGTPGSPQLGEYISTVPRYQYHDLRHGIFYMPQDTGNSSLYIYKSLDG